MVGAIFAFGVYPSYKKYLQSIEISTENELDLFIPVPGNECATISPSIQQRQILAPEAPLIPMPPLVPFPPISSFKPHAPTISMDVLLNSNSPFHTHLKLINPPKLGFINTPREVKPNVENYRDPESLMVSSISHSETDSFGRVMATRSSFVKSPSTYSNLPPPSTTYNASTSSLTTMCGQISNISKLLSNIFYERFEKVHIVTMVFSESTDLAVHVKCRPPECVFQLSLGSNSRFELWELVGLFS